MMNQAFSKDTVQSREKIGFPKDPSEWAESKAEFSADNSTLKIMGHPVMESWEAPYMELLAQIATSQGGRVLEIGFGLGISAKFIQRHPIAKHEIIEANKEVYSKALKFSQEARVATTIHYGFWEDIVESFPDKSFDGILFDTYPLSSAEIHCQHYSFFSHAFRLLAPNGVLTYYSDEVAEFGEAHARQLKAAGFEKIHGTICSVNPPSDCLYWKSDTILAPRIQK